eukprot:TRINITY_DN39_c0_g6_i1.p1 TRINITY_DN39_c0_g6~~TRINITY_DN39_c0_g6_i1.p1  ORF type:complete len:479 (+),score=88.21 TRINITY_DN39_c0_g6_i1:40-1476(+)
MGDEINFDVDDNKNINNKRLTQNFYKRVFAYLVFFLFGVSSWLLVNSLFVEMGELINITPEGTKIASLLSLIIQFGNIGAFILILLLEKKWLHQEISILIIIIIAIGSSVICYGTEITFGTNYSIVLYIGCFGGGLGGAMSVVSYFAFASMFDYSTTSAVATGMGASGLIASAIGISQTLIEFDIVVFFAINTVVLVISFLSFFLIVLFPFYFGLDRNDIYKTFFARYLKKSQVLSSCYGDDIYNISDDEKEKEEEERKLHELEREKENNLYENNILLTSTTGIHDSYIESNDNTNKTKYQIIKETYPILLHQLIICFLYYFLFGVIPYAVSEYKKSGAYTNWIYTGGLVFASIARFACSFKVLLFYKFIILTSLQVILFIPLSLCCYFGYTTFIPDDWIWVVVFFYIIFSILNGYQVTGIYQSARLPKYNHYVEELSRYLGTANQLGAFFGSVFSFFLVYFGVFHGSDSDSYTSSYN